MIFCLLFAGRGRREGSEKGIEKGKKISKIGGKEAVTSCC